MSSVPGSILWFIVAISVLVAVHEYGHYIVGRLCGMKVLRFSIGFGKPLFSWTGKSPDRTEYWISSIPLGGYVKFLDEREAPVDPEDQGRAFTHRPIPARIAVLLAGPAFNFLFAILAYWLLFVQGIPAMKPAVGAVEPASFASEAGLEYGDRIVAIGDDDAANWETALVAMLDEMITDGRIPMRLENADGYERSVTIDVGDARKDLTEPGELFDGLGFQPWQPPVAVAQDPDDGPAKDAGLLEGDVIVGVNELQVTGFASLTDALTAYAGEEAEITFLRDGQERSAFTTVAVHEEDGVRSGRLNVIISRNYGDLVYNRQFAALPALSEATAQTWDTMAFTMNMLGRMITGDVSLRNISGPISIAQYAGESASLGYDRFLRFLALISISLGIINLFPIPMLDGGQIVYQTVEAIKGSPLSERTQLLGQQVGILALLLLMSFAFYNDFARLFG